MGLLCRWVAGNSDVSPLLPHPVKYPPGRTFYSPPDVRILPRVRILIVDNNDSFTRNLEQLLATVSGERPLVMNVADFARKGPGLADFLVISPGPGHPREYACYTQFLLSTELPVLGVCLGMQLMNQVYGGSTAKLPGCVHGVTSPMHFGGQEHHVARYHSLYVERMAAEFTTLAALSQDILPGICHDIPMIIKHVDKPLLGYQFHPESFLSQTGEQFIDYALHTLY